VIGSSSAVGTASRKLSQVSEADNNGKGGPCIPLQNREVEINLSISDKLLQIRFTDTTDRIDIRCPPGQLNDENGNIS
jgi:hypothetical protein